MRMLIKNTNVHPNSGPISVYFESYAPPGSETLIKGWLNLTHYDVAARAPAGVPWDDPELLEAGRVELEKRYPGQGFTLEYPEPDPVSTAPVMPIRTNDDAPVELFDRDGVRINADGSPFVGP